MALTGQLSWQGNRYSVDWSSPLSIGIPLRPGHANPKAWHAPDPDFSPVRAGNFVGKVTDGGGVNFFNAFCNPHGNGTHTECVGHITPEHHTLSDCPVQPIAMAQLLTVAPSLAGKDTIITAKQVLPLITTGIEAVVIRTLPNGQDKLTKDYTQTNPPFFAPELLDALAQQGVRHFLTDLPSVDKEEDGGALAAHKAWWQYPDTPRWAATITEMIFVPDEIADGLYLLNLMYPRWALDAAPSQPLLFPLREI